MPFLTVLFIAGAILIPGPGERTARGPAPGAAPPNFLVVLLDDVGVDKVGAYGEHPDAGPTPVFDLVATHGVLYRNAWAMPVCSPTRASTLTGRSPARHGIGIGVGNNGLTISADEVMLPRILGRLGYRSAMVGKWHLSGAGVDFPRHPIDCGFDRVAGPKQNIGDFSNWVRHESDGVTESSAVTNAYATTQQVDDALAIIDEWSDGGAPWLMWLAFNAPHTPLHAPPEHLHTQGPLTGGEPAPVLYRAMLEAADAELGRLLAGMRPAALANTWVIVLGDNGTPGPSNTPPFGGPGNNKGDVKEGGVNVPMAIWGPGVVPHEETRLVGCMDLFNTLLELAGGAPPSDRPIDGRSLVPTLFTTDGPPVHRALYARTHTPNGAAPTTVSEAARDTRYKLIRHDAPPNDPVSADPIQFFDLVADPFEQDDLVGALSQLTPEQRARFDALLLSLP